MDEVFKTVQDMFAKDMMGDAKYLFTHNYFEDIEFLLNKYGAAKYDYFCTESMKKRNSKASRTKEGLFCHHIYEYEYPLICNPIVAQKYPFEIQKKENLCYCNILEHLILHIKIDDEYRDHGYNCGTQLICQTISRFFRPTILLEWEKKCAGVFLSDMDNIVSLSCILGYLMTMEQLVEGKTSLNRCKEKYSGKYIDVMLDLSQEPLGKRACCYSLNCKDGFFNYFDIIEEALSSAKKQLPLREYTNIYHLCLSHRGKEEVSIKDLKSRNRCWRCKYFYEIKKCLHSLKYPTEGICSFDKDEGYVRITNLNSECRYFERRE